jgi:hypothetical protein
VRDNGLAIFFGVAFLAALTGQAIAGHIAYNADQAAHRGEAISFGRYLTSSDFGQAVMENWQSEYLQFLLFIVVTVWLVQRGSPESKEVEESWAGHGARATDRALRGPRRSHVGSGRRLAHRDLRQLAADSRSSRSRSPAGPSTTTSRCSITLTRSPG